MTHPKPDEDAAAQPESPNIGWAGGALLLTASLAIVAKAIGVVVLPGLRGVASQPTVEGAEIVSATLANTLVGLLVALVCGASFELARARRVSLPARVFMVGSAGLIVALAAPAVVQRLHTFAALALAVAASFVAVVGGVHALRATHTRAAGAVVTVIAFAGMLRVGAWAMASIGAERASLAVYDTGRGLATGSVVLQGLATLLAAAWLGTRAALRGRVLANLAIVGAFAVTYLAARESDGPTSALEAVLRTSLGQVQAVPEPYAVATVGAFLLPASILLSVVALVQRGQPVPVLAAIALGLLSGAAFDVPLQALAITASAQWAILGMADDRSMWAALVGKRAAPPPPVPPAEPASDA